MFKSLVFSTSTMGPSKLGPWFHLKLDRKQLKGCSSLIAMKSCYRCFLFLQSKSLLRNCAINSYLAGLPSILLNVEFKLKTWTFNPTAWKRLAWVLLKNKLNKNFKAVNLSMSFLWYSVRFKSIPISS